MRKGKKNEPGDFDSVERSDKVKKLLGEAPPAPVRWGTAIITLFFVLLFIALSIIPYPGTDTPIILYFTMR
jgi:hypothetical protein